MSEENAEYGLIISFPDPSASFVNGFEAGYIWQRMWDQESPIEEVLHSANVDLFKMQAGHHGYAFDFQPTEFPEWTKCKFEKIVTPQENKTKSRFKLINGGIA